MDELNKAYSQNIDDTSAFNKMPEKSDEKIIIKAIGVGGGGNNAVNHMYREGINNVSFVNINTDRQALLHSVVPNILEIGDGLGGGNVPEKAHDFAEQSADEIAALFDDGTKMVFITAGMGGGTGTGAAPVVARIAKERGLLTIGIVTIPFLFEGQKKIKKAIAGVDEMSKYVDALLVINNERLTEIYGDLSFLNAFGKADDTLSIAARSISDIITGQGHINLDFNDVDTTLRNGGPAIISSGYGEGENRVTAAIQDALKSPLLKNRDILGSKKLLFYLYFDPNAEDEFRMSETHEINDFISSINTDVDVIWGIGFDETLGNQVKMTILAAGFEFDDALNKEEEEFLNGAKKIWIGGGRSNAADNNTASAPQAKSEKPKAAPAKPKTPEVSDKRIAEEYGASKLMDLTGGGKDRQSTIVLGPNQLDDDAICDILEKYPTYKRDRKIVEQVRNGAMGMAAEQPATQSSSQTFIFG